MINTLIQLFDQVKEFNNNNSYIDLILIFLTILGGYGSKRFLKDLLIATQYKVLLSSLVLYTIYFLLPKENGEEVTLVKYFLSFTTSNFLYSYILKFFTKKSKTLLEN